MTPNFDKLYDTAMDCRAQIIEEIKKSGVNVLGTGHAYFEVSERVNFRVMVMPADFRYNTISIYATSDDRDCTEEEIRQATAAAIADIRKLTRQGQIEELRARLAELEREED